MTITRQWLDWNQPCLPQAAQWLIEQSSSESDALQRVCALDHMVCVTGGKRAGRLLIEQLLRECDARKLHLAPPRTITIGRIADELLEDLAGASVVATVAESQMAWVNALQNATADQLRVLLARLPERDDVLAWHELARTFQKLHDELSGEQLSFADAADHAERMELFGEADRWRALESLLCWYRDVLESHNLLDPHVAKADLIQQGQAKTTIHLVLLGVVELNAQQRAAVKRFTEQGGKVTALVHTSEALCDRFDELGCVDVEAWSDVEIDLDDDRIVVADRPKDQAQAAMHMMASFNGTYAADQITIGLGDGQFGEIMHHAAAWAELHVHSADGLAMSRTLPYRLFEVIAAWLSGQRFVDFAAMLRHPDMEQYLHARLRDAAPAIDDWIGLLDAYFSDHLHARLTGTWLGKDEVQQRLKAIHDTVEQLLAPLHAPPQPLGQWSQGILAVLRSVYGERTAMPSHSREACLTVHEVLIEATLLHPQLQPTVDASTALRFTMRACQQATIVELSRDEQIEMLGWLELHLDPAPALVVLGVNDGQIPGAVTADAFLPDQLRSRLGLACNARRYARDAYVLTALKYSRESVTLVAGRRAADGESLAPSRLLLACKSEHLPQRVAKLCGADEARRWLQPMGAPQPRSDCMFLKPPEPPALPAELNLSSHYMRVTDFRTYLKCAYRYWLNRIEHLKVAGDDGDELDPMGFGTLAHNVLERFGMEESIRDSSDAVEIAAFLVERVDVEGRRKFGSQPPPAVRVQLSRLKTRLEIFAALQADLRSQGWKIEVCEFALPKETVLDIPGQEPVRISGKIDRIDRHEQTGERRLIDYKTSETRKTPFEVHHGKKTVDEEQWLDLQLPLYRHLAAQHGYNGGVEVGYIVLPKNVSHIEYLPGHWTDEQFEIAIDKARDVVMDIREARFEMNRNVNASHDEFANICRANVLGDDDDGDEGGEDL